MRLKHNLKLTTNLQYSVAIVMENCVNTTFSSSLKYFYPSPLKGPSIIVDIFLYDNSYRKRGEGVEKCW